MHLMTFEIRWISNFGRHTIPIRFYKPNNTVHFEFDSTEIHRSREMRIDL